jgi:hypothetical protein
MPTLEQRKTTNLQKEEEGRKREEKERENY